MNTSNRMSGAIVIEANNSNANGDPDGDGPRIDPLGYGWISYMAFRAKFRNVLEDAENPVAKYLFETLKLDPEQYRIFESRAKGFPGADGLNALKMLTQYVKENGNEGLLKRYWDIRLFGTTALEEKGTDAVKFTRTGCLQISHLFTVHPVEVISATIAKKAPLDAKNAEAGNGTFGNQALRFVRHGLYVGSYNFNPGDAYKTGATSEDLELFKMLAPRAFELCPSAARTGVRTVAVFHAEHSSPIGSFNVSAFLDACRPKVKEGVESPLSLADYDMPSLDAINSVPGVNAVQLS